MPHTLSPEQQVQRLRNQIGWITRLSATLSITRERDDIFSLILTGLVSPVCLGYSQAIFLSFSPEHGALRGEIALYHESREDFDQLAVELAEEENFLRARRGPEDTPHLPATGDLLEADPLHWLVDNSSWVILSQRLPTENPVTERLSNLSFRLGGDESHFLADALSWKRATALSKAELGAALPPSLALLLPDHFAASPIPSQRGLRGVLLVDRRLTPVMEFDHSMLDELEWFSRQAALALDNAEINADLIRTNEELKQIDTLKSNFLSIISHELRTPLTSMSGFVDLVLDEKVGPVNENQRTLLTRVSKNTAHLAHLVNDLLEVAQTKAEGTVEVELCSVDPLEVLVNTIPKLEQRRRETDVEVEPRLDLIDEVPKIVADERALGRIFFHLLDNAMKFSPSGAVVEVVFRAEDNELYIDVVDQGVGIPPQKIRHIFEQFYQVDNTLTRSFEGLGLGLAVTRILVQATHARILVRSEEGQGSVFTVVFPISR